MTRRRFPDFSQFFISTLFGILVALPITATAQPAAGARSQPTGSVSFAPVVTYRTGGTEATFVAVADFNGDGTPDLAIANAYFVNTIGILLGNGDGTFQRAVPYRTSAGFANTIVPVDLNGDGKLDLVVASQSRCYPCSQEGSISVFMGNGDGTFQLTNVYDSGGLGFGNGGFGNAEMAVADINGDGNVDIVAANCASKRSTSCGVGDGIITVLLGYGDGTFQPATSRNSGIPHMGTAIALADLNGDGVLDLIASSSQCSSSTSCLPGKVDILLGNGDATFSPTANYPSATWGVTGVASADVNGDGKLDLIVGGCGGTNCWNEDGIVSVLLGNGDGTFQSAVPFDSGGPLADGLALTDINQDGAADIVVANVISESVGVLLGNGDGTFASPLTFGGGNDFVYSVAVHDLNGDGKPDILVTACSIISTCGGSIPGSVGVLMNTTTPSGMVKLGHE